ncbi:GTP cyclohydrolase I [Elusimicrobium simillimum]|uniref:GTP cyclohydrolase I FolE n=1 Tax=Elusimicrobium simillimum TaxID=3143438 RepID=UPI003C6EC86E
MRKNNKSKPLSKAKPANTQVRKPAITEAKAHQNWRELLAYIGEDPNREGLLETPKRIVKSWDKLFGGYKQKPESVLKTFVEGSCDEMVVLKDIEFYSTCEHHFQPFFGTISIGYLPNKRVLGVSKLARLVEIYSRRLQIQEKLSAEIADSLMKHLNPLGVMVVCKARHMCVCSRGVEKHNAVMITSAIRGVFKKPEVRSEFLDFIQ